VEGFVNLLVHVVNPIQIVQVGKFVAEESVPLLLIVVEVLLFVVMVKTVAEVLAHHKGAAMGKYVRQEPIAVIKIVYLKQILVAQMEMELIAHLLLKHVVELRAAQVQSSAVMGSVLPIVAEVQVVLKGLVVAVLIQ
jgi:hypothetical protein